MNYKLDTSTEKSSLIKALKKLLPYLKGENAKLVIAFAAIIINSGLLLLSPLLVGQAINRFILTKQPDGMLAYSALIMGVFVLAAGANYIQSKVMGGVGQRLLFTLRNAIFTKLQKLPIAFFNQNKAGDLISRINSDTDNLNNFFSQSLMQFIGNVFVIIGATVFILAINLKLGLAALTARCRTGHYPSAFSMDQAAQCQEPAAGWQHERRDSGKPGQFQGNRRIQP